MIAKSLIEKSSKHYVILFNLLLASYFVVTAFKPIPDSTHYLASFLDHRKSPDLVNHLITYIKTPFYYFFGSFFQSPLIYNVSSFLINFIFLNSIFFVILKLSKKIFYSFLIVCLIIFFKFLIKVSNFFTLDIFNFFNYFLINADLLDIFTVRQFFGITFLFSIFFLLEKKFYLALLLTFLNNFTHPNSNLFSILILVIYFLFKVKEDKYLLKYLLILLLTNSFFFVFLFLKISNYPDIDLHLNHSYYTYLIKDEADDFSFLWLLSYNPSYFVVILFIHLLNLFFYFKKISKVDDLILLNIIPILLFILGAIIEFVNLNFRFHLIEILIINTQPSWKLLGYSFFPFLIILVHNFSKYSVFQRFFNQKKILIFTALTIILFFTVGIQRNYSELKFFLNYSLKHNYENDFEEWLKAYSKYNSYNYFPKFVKDSETNEIKMSKIFADENNIFKIKKTFDNNTNINYEELFNFNDGYNLAKAIKKNIPKNSGIIIPPYIFNFRGTLKDYLIYFEEHPDGNFAMGNFKFFKVIHQRMFDLFGFGYENFPNKQSGLNTSFIRQEYLKISTEKLIKIKNKYRNYNYFVTEKKHSLNFPVIYEDKVFKIYNLKK